MNNTSFLYPTQTHGGKNGRRISFIKHDLTATLTSPTPPNSLFPARCS